jgi:hypothetical protein
VHASKLRFLSSPYKPAGADIEKWASDPFAVEPIDDWNLVLAQQPHLELYLRLAASSECPKAHYFLTLLYLIVGKAVRSDYATRPRYEIEHLLAVADADYTEPQIRLWTKRSVRLIANPAIFNYTDWCGGALALLTEETSHLYV